MSAHVYSKTQMYDINGNVTGACLTMEVNVPCGGIQRTNIYANSTKAAVIYLYDYARYVGVGHWYIGVAEGCNFSTVAAGNYEFYKLST